MRNPELWQPTKFVRTTKGLRASRSAKWVSPGSRYIVDLIAGQYERLINEHARGRLLDMGCGDVPLYDTYRNLVTENVCADWGSTLHPNEFLDMSFDLNGALPIEDASFDTILLTDVLEHVAEPARLMSEIARVLRANGKLILGVPFFYWVHEQPHDYHRYTEFALRRFCELGGLKITELEPYGGLAEIFTDLTSKAATVLPTRRRVFLVPVQKLALAFGKISAVQRLSRSTARTFPLGYVLVAQKTV